MKKSIAITLTNNEMCSTSGNDHFHITIFNFTLKNVENTLRWDQTICDIHQHTDITASDCSEDINKWVLRPDGSDYTHLWITIHLNRYYILKGLMTASKWMWVRGLRCSCYKRCPQDICHENSHTHTHTHTHTQTHKVKTWPAVCTKPKMFSDIWRTIFVHHGISKAIQNSITMLCQTFHILTTANWLLWFRNSTWTYCNFNNIQNNYAAQINCSSWANSHKI